MSPGRFRGEEQPLAGLADGYDADLIRLDADPLTDTTILADPAYVTGGFVRET